MALATSNLSVNSMLTTLGVSTPRAIFYASGTLRTAAQLATIVSKDGLSATYCPGANADARLANLLADRKLSYFKGYNHITNFLTIDPTEMYFPAATLEGGEQTATVTANSGVTFTISSNQSWATASESGGIITVAVETNTNPISRDATINVSASNGLSDSIIIYQNPA